VQQAIHHKVADNTKTSFRKVQARTGIVIGNQFSQSTCKNEYD